MIELIRPKIEIEQWYGWRSERQSSDRSLQGVTERNRPMIELARPEIEKKNTIEFERSRDWTILELVRTKIERN